jgi:hypothetical protein
MAATFTWNIATMERTNDADQGVIVVHWRLNGDDDGVTAGADGPESFTPDPSSDDFIPYNDLTEETVVGWVTDAWGEDKYQNVLDAIQQKIDDQRNPPTVAGVPWE